jgi:DNA-binding HxlR family transcriptional regulator
MMVLFTGKFISKCRRKVEYSLTEVGRTLIPILLSMREWGVAYEAHLGGELLFSGEEYEPRGKLEIEEVVK